MFKKVAIASPLAFIAGSVFAAVPEAVTQEIATAKTDAVTVGAAVLAVIIAIFALKLVRRAL